MLLLKVQGQGRSENVLESLAVLRPPKGKFLNEMQVRAMIVLQ